MNLVDKLLKVDAGKVEEKKTKELKSKRLGEILGMEGAATIIIQEIRIKRMNDIIAKQYNSKGVFDASKSFDAKALACAESIIEPDVKNKDLMEHFNCQTPKDLVIKLFGGELNSISDEVTVLSGFANVDETDEEVKN